MSKSHVRVAVVAGAVWLVLGSVVPTCRADVVTAPVSTDAPAAAPATSADEDKWTFTSPLYMWAAALTGTATLQGNNVTLDESFTDLLDNMDGGFMAYLQLAKPQYGFYVNPNYYSLSFDGRANGTKLTLDTQMWIIEMAGFYRIWDHAGERPAALYVVGGLRYWNLHNNLQVQGLGSTADGDWLLDPMIGLRFKEYITKRVHLMGQTDVGGFNLAGQTSRFSWQLMANIGYDFTMPVIKKPSTVFAGWRQINVQKTSGSGTVNQDAFNLNMSGILVGLNVELF